MGATQGFEPKTAALRPANSYGPDGKVHGFYASGSGFSEYFPRPKYQDKVVPAYVKALNSQNAGLYNPSKFFFPLSPSTSPKQSANSPYRRPRLSRHRRPRPLLPNRLELYLQDHFRDQRLHPINVLHNRPDQRCAHLLRQSASRLPKSINIQ